MLVLRYGERLLKTLLGFHHVAACALVPQEEFSFEPIQLCCPPVLPTVVCHSGRLRQQE